MDKLKPCPFCGSDDLSVHFDDGFSYYVWCGNCGSQTDNDHLTKKEAIKAWNTRPTEDALKAEVEELRYIVEQFSTWTAEGGCVKSNFPDFPCWWERNRAELELDDYCDDDDEREHKCWVEYYRWKYRQKLNAPDMNVATIESEGEMSKYVNGVCPESCAFFENGYCVKPDGVCTMYPDYVKRAESKESEGEDE